MCSPTSGGRSVGIVRSRTQATEFQFFMKLKTVARISLYSKIRIDKHILSATFILSDYRSFGAASRLLLICKSRTKDI
jgi:hypothetical protein